MRTLNALLLAGLLFQSDDFKKGVDTIKAADIQKHQVYIASDDLAGRDAGSDGGHKAALYIAEKCQEYGLEPAGESGTWFQPFGGGGSEGAIEDANLLKIFKDTTLKAADEFKLNAGFMPLKVSKAGAVSGQIIVAGFGITAPENDYDDYKGLKLKGEIAVVMDGKIPSADPKWTDEKAAKYGEWAHKIEAATAAGAGAVVIVAGDELPKRDDLAWPGDKEPGTKIPAVVVTKAVGAAICKAGSKDLAKVREEIATAGKPRSFRVTKPAKLQVSHRGLPGKGTKNICAIWRGSDEKLRDEYIVIGAHYDHVGMGEQGSRGGQGKVHNGADDDASGTCALLDIAQALPQIKPKRSVVCLWFDAEEKGLVGSREWTGKPTLPIDKCVFMIQLDMIGRNETTKILAGVEKTAKTPKYDKLAKLMGQAEAKFGLKFDWDGADELIQRSDHWNFMTKGIPAVFFTGGLHADYHTDKDDVEKINFAKEELIARIAFWLMHKVANGEVLK